MELALAGGHCIVMIGPPGSGKTLLARTVPGCCLRLNDDEARVATIIASVSAAGPLVGARADAAVSSAPPHPQLCGDGRRWPHMSPGEVTLANNGVLFLDELPEFDRATLEALRQPLEDGQVAISRVGRAAVFPSRFQLSRQ